MIDSGLRGLKKNSGYEKYAAAGTTYWQSTTEYRITAGVGQRIYILYGNIYRSQNATVTTTLNDSSNNVLMALDYQAAATGTTTFPNTVAAASATHGIAYPIILDPGDYLKISFGAAQDTNAYVAVSHLEDYL